MRFRTLWLPQPEAFIKSLAPEPRRAIGRAIKQLAGARTTGLDLRPLEGPLRAYMRMRVGIYRIIYQVILRDRKPTLVLVAAGPRSTVYEAFEKILAEKTGN